jgi:hypothetical protein
MIMTICDPQRLLPYHGCYPERLQPYPLRSINEIKPGELQGLMPRIPVFEIPTDLEYLPGHLARELGDYILYNGHHRRLAAICAHVREVEIAVLQTDEDLVRIEPWELLEILSTSIVEHQERVFDNVPEGTLEALLDQKSLLANSIASGTIPRARQAVVEATEALLQMAAG